MIIQPYALPATGSLKTGGTTGGAAQASPAPQFGFKPGGLAQRVTEQANNKLVGLFSNIMEVYLWYFLAMDVVALWITRIVAGAKNGAKKYDAAKDETNRNLSPWQVWKKSQWENLKGLNWPNAIEEACREVLTGPMTLLLPSVAFILGARGFGRSSVELGHGPMSRLKDSFIHFLSQNPALAEGPISPEAYRMAVRDFGRGMLAPELNGCMGNRRLSALRPSEINPVWERLLAGREGQTVREFTDDWLERWSKAAFEHLQRGGEYDAKGVRTALETLNEEMEAVVVAANRRYALDRRLTRSGDITVALYDREKQGLVNVERPVDGFLSDFRRWRDYALEVFEVRQKHVAERLPDLAEKVYQRLVGKKLVFALMATFGSGLYLAILPRLSQSHSHYPAVAHLKKPDAVREAPPPGLPGSFAASGVATAGGFTR